jgi:hypothetical protein
LAEIVEESGVVPKKVRDLYSEYVVSLDAGEEKRRRKEKQEEAEREEERAERSMDREEQRQDRHERRMDERDRQLAATRSSAASEPKERKPADPPPSVESVTKLATKLAADRIRSDVPVADTTAGRRSLTHHAGGQGRLAAAPEVWWGNYFASCTSPQSACSRRIGFEIDPSPWGASFLRRLFVVQPRASVVPSQRASDVTANVVRSSRAR